MNHANDPTTTGDCDGIPSEVINAQALLDRVRELLGVPLADLLKTVEALPRWVPVETVKDGTPFFASARPPHFGATTYPDEGGGYRSLPMCQEWRRGLAGGFVLINGLYPKPPVKP